MAEIDFLSKSKGLYFLTFVISPSAEVSINTNKGIREKIYTGKIVIE